MSPGESLAALRRRAGLSQADIATHLGVTRFTPSKWETGQAAMSARQVARWFDLVGASTEERLQVLNLLAAQAAGDVPAPGPVVVEAFSFDPAGPVVDRGAA